MCVSAAMMQVGAMGIQAVGDLGAGYAQGAALDGQARVAQQGAGMRARQIRREAYQETGSARAVAAASGVKVGSGSVMEAERDIARYSEQDAISVILSGDMEANGLQSRARQPRRAGVIAAGDSLLVAGDTWARRKKPDPHGFTGTRTTGD